MTINEALTLNKKRGTVCIRGIKKFLISVFYFAGIICTTATIWTSVRHYVTYPSRNVVREAETISKRDIIERMKHIFRNYNVRLKYPKKRFSQK